MFPACHLDIVPFATEEKWGHLSNDQRLNLINISRDTLGTTLRTSAVRTLILNGRSVVDHFSQIANVNWQITERSDWSLQRSSGSDILGYTFSDTVSQIGGIELEREITVLGYNHNLQSSYGVTSEIILSIRNWVEETAA
jgi:hypothetical protein